MLSLLHEPDRALRRSAMETLYRGLAEQSQVLSFIYDTLLQDHLTMDRLRLYSDPMAQRHLSNEIDATAVKIMMEVTEEHYGLAQDYFRLKAQLLKLPRIAVYDQYAPPGQEAHSFHYAQEQELISKHLKRSIPPFAEWPRSSLPTTGSMPRCATANAAARFAPRLRQSCIPTSFATTMINYAMR